MLAQYTLIWNLFSLEIIVQKKMVWSNEIIEFKVSLLF